MGQWIADWSWLRTVEASWGAEKEFDWYNTFIFIVYLNVTHLWILALQLSMLKAHLFANSLSCCPCCPRTGWRWKILIFCFKSKSAHSHPKFSGAAHHAAPEGLSSLSSLDSIVFDKVNLFIRRATVRWLFVIIISPTIISCKISHYDVQWRLLVIIITASISF